MQGVLCRRDALLALVDDHVMLLIEGPHREYCIERALVVVNHERCLYVWVEYGGHLNRAINTVSHRRERVCYERVCYSRVLCVIPVSDP